MSQMTDPTNSLISFQDAFRRGIVRPQQCELDKELFVLLDQPTGTPRFSYVRIRDKTITALVMFVLIEPIDGVPCFQIGYAVPERHRNVGLATTAVLASIEELRNGLGRSEAGKFCVEAIVGVDNKSSQRVLEKAGFPQPEKITEEVSGEPAIQYVLQLTTR